MDKTINVCGELLSLASPITDGAVLAISKHPIPATIQEAFAAKSSVDVVVDGVGTTKALITSIAVGGLVEMLILEEFIPSP